VIIMIKLKCVVCGQIVEDDDNAVFEHLMQCHKPFLMNYLKGLFSQIEWNEEMQEAYDIYINDLIKESKEIDMSQKA